MADLEQRELVPPYVPGRHGGQWPRHKHRARQQRAARKHQAREHRRARRQAARRAA